MTIWTFSQTSTWAYVSRPVISGLPREAVFGAGPAACAMSALVAAVFLDRRSPLSWPIAPRASGQLQLRIALVLVGWWCLALVLAALIYTLILLRRSEAGHYYPAEALLAVPMLAVMVAAGVLVGVVVSRWWAPAVALLLAGVMVFLPSEMLRLVEYDPTLVAPFAFYLSGAFDHRALLASGIAAVTAWWWAGLATVGLLLVGWTRGIARRGWGVAATSAAASIAVAGLAAPLVSMPLFTSDAPSASVCEVSEFGVEVCVSAEERALLPTLRAEAERMTARLGLWPERYTMIASERGWDAIHTERPHQEEAHTLIAPTSVYGVSGGVSTVAFTLSGHDTCIEESRDPSAPESNASYYLGLWIEARPDALEFLAVGPEWAETAGATDEEVRAWYAENRDALLACDYTAGAL